MQAGWSVRKKVSGVICDKRVAATFRLVLYNVVIAIRKIYTL